MGMQNAQINRWGIPRGRENRGASDYHPVMATRSRRGRPPHDDVLTPAEWRIVHHVKHGMTSREIARRRGVSINAVKYHVANALAKLGLTNRKQLRHWHQPPKGSALHIKENSVDTPIQIGPIGQIARSVRDIKESPESTLYLRVPDITAAHDKLASRGVEFISAPHLIHRHADGTEEWMAFFKDPEGADTGHHFASPIALSTKE
jgi:DNA-binding CsgD family transcriptional regulator